MILNAPFTRATITTLLASGIVVTAPVPMGSRPKGHTRSASLSLEGAPSYSTNISPSTQNVLARSASFPLLDAKQRNSNAPAGSKKSLIIHTDGKFDDKLGITTAERIDDYHDIHVILNGIKNRQASVGDMADWDHHLKQLNEKLGTNFPLAKKRFYHGSTPFLKTDTRTGQVTEDAVPHEALFVKPGKDVKVPKLHRFNELEQKLKKAKVKYGVEEARHLIIAPTPEKEILNAARYAKSSGIKVTHTGHILGYNTRQDVDSRDGASPATQSFATRLNDKLQNIHGPDHKLIITNSHHNMGGHGGTTQDYRFLEPRLPQHHVDQVGVLEPFHKIQLERFSDMILAKDGNAKVEKYVGRKNGVMDQMDVWIMRINRPDEYPETKRLLAVNIPKMKHNLEELIRVMKGTDNNPVKRMRSAISGIEDGNCAAEACDANHIGLHYIAMEREKQGIKAFEPIHIGSNIALKKAGAGEAEHGISPIPHPNSKKEVTELLRKIYPTREEIRAGWQRPKQHQYRLSSLPSPSPAGPSNPHTV